VKITVSNDLQSKSSNQMLVLSYINVTAAAAAAAAATTVIQLSGFYPGRPRWPGTRRNIHPLTPIMSFN